MGTWTTNASIRDLQLNVPPEGQIIIMVMHIAQGRKPESNQRSDQKQSFKIQEQNIIYVMVVNQFENLMESKNSFHEVIICTLRCSSTRLDSSPVLVREVPKHISRQNVADVVPMRHRLGCFLMFWGDGTENKRTLKGFGLESSLGVPRWCFLCVTWISRIPQRISFGGGGYFYTCTDENSVLMYGNIWRGGIPSSQIGLVLSAFCQCFRGLDSFVDPQSKGTGWGDHSGRARMVSPSKRFG